MTRARKGGREAGEGGKAGVAVRLLDETGENEIASTTTDADGNYLFDDLAAGIYLVEFGLPANQRLAAAVGGPDPTTRRVQVATYEDQLDIGAGYYLNSAPVASDGIVRTHKNTATFGNALAGATDADGDTLTAAVDSGPAHGALSLGANGD